MRKQQSLTDLVSIRTLEKIQDNFSLATGIGCVIRDHRGERITKNSSASALWEATRKNKKNMQEYQEILLDTFKKCQKNGHVEIVQRYMDCYAFIVPIFAEGSITAYFVGGLTRFGNPDIHRCTEESAKQNIDLDTFLEMYWALPLVSKEKLEACANLLKIIASTISTIAKEGSEAKEMNILLEKEIIESEERYKKLFNTIYDGVYVTDKDGFVKEMNRAGAKILGYGREELIGKQIRSVYVNPEDRNEFIEKLYRDGHIEHFHPFIKTKSGKKKFLETSATIMKDSNGKVTGVQGIFRDVDPRSHCSLKVRNKSHESPKASYKSASNNKKSPQKA